MILGVALYPYFGVNGVLFPLVARAFGLIATIIGILAVTEKGAEKGSPMDALNKGYYICTIFATLFFFGASVWMFGSYWPWFFAAGVVGIALSIVFVHLTRYYTDYTHRPVLEIVKSSVTGPATNIISGFAVALETTALPAIAIAISLILANQLGMERHPQRRLVWHCHRHHGNARHLCLRPCHGYVRPYCRQRWWHRRDERRVRGNSTEDCQA